MEKPETVSQAMWDRLSDRDKAFVIEHERKHREARDYGFTSGQVLDGTKSDADAYRRNRWMFG